MARIRTIKPEFWTDEDLAEVSEPSLLLAIGLLNHADDEGYFRANPALVKAAIFPIREPSLSIHGMLTELSNAGYLRLFEGSDGKKYGLILNFTKHQKINRPSASKIKMLDIFTEDSVNTHGGLTPGKEQGTGKGKDKTSLSLRAREPVDNSPTLVLDDYQPPPDMPARLMRAGRPDVNPNDLTLIAKFVAHHRGKGTVSPDWDSMFLSWCLHERNPGETDNGKTDRRSRAKRVADKLDEIAARDIAKNGLPKIVG